MRFFLAIFLILAIAFPALASGEGFDKAWAEARPGWYLKISYGQGRRYWRDTGSIYWWTSHNLSRPDILPPEDVLVFISADIDQRNKPTFIKKESVLPYKFPLSGCLGEALFFQVDGQTSEASDPLVSFSSVVCRKIVRWEFLRKSCGNENFIACIADKFSKKFPFDILFNLPSTQITCPKVNFFGSKFDICFIYEAMRMMKYPIAAALIMKLFLYL